MSGPVFSCPQTGHQIEHGIEGAQPAQSGAGSVRFTALHVRCPHCGEHHEIQIDQGPLIEAA